MLGGGYPQKATYWAPAGESLYGAQNAFTAPAILMVRWEDRQQQAVGSNGVTFTTQSVVFIPEAVEVGGYLALGDYSEITDPSMVPDALEIKGIITVPDLRNIVTERRALL